MDYDSLLESLMKPQNVRKYPLSMYCSEGTKYLNLCQYDKAIEFLGKAVDIDPNNVKALLTRARCFIALKEYKKAIADVNDVLRLSPNRIAAIDLKGQAQYLMGDFEGGYLTYLDGRKIKPLNENFRLGEQLCKQALDNSLLRSRDSNVDSNDMHALSKIEKDDRMFENQLKYRKSHRECFGRDRKFMEDLMMDSNLTSIHGFCKEAFDYIKARERFWTMETPLYTRRKIPKIVKRDMRKPSAAERQAYIFKAAQRRAECELKKSRIDDCLSEVEKMLSAIEILPIEVAKDKMKLKCYAYHLKGVAYKKGGNYSLCAQYIMKELEIANEWNLKIPQTRAFHILGEYFQKTGNMSRAFICFDKVISAMDPQKIDELAMEEASPEEMQHLEEAYAWASSIVSNIMMSVREPVSSPVLDTIMECSEDIQFEDSSFEDRETDNERSNNLKQNDEEINESSESTHLTGPVMSIDNQDSIEDEQSVETALNSMLLLISKNDNERVILS